MAPTIERIVFRLLKYRNRLKKPSCAFSYNYIQRRYGSSKILQFLHERGLVNDIFPRDCPDLPLLLSSGRLCAYAGFDPTSDSLHIGNLLVLIALLHWQRAGHQAIVVIGDATARLGDPSGHTRDRNSLSCDDAISNTKSIENSLHNIFENHKNYIWCQKQSKSRNLQTIKILKNSDWYHQKNVIEFLVQVGRHLRIGPMLSRTSVKSRMESGEGMSFTEFSYQLFQANDWLHLFHKYNCMFQSAYWAIDQLLRSAALYYHGVDHHFFTSESLIFSSHACRVIGGSDQMGNIYSGFNLITGLHNKTVYGLTLPLIKTEIGDKYGKTAGNAVYLNRKRTSPFEFYQFFLSLKDSEIGMFLKYFTFLSATDIEMIIQKHMQNPDKRYGQKIIAEQLTLLVHGEEGLKSAKAATAALFHSDIESLSALSEQEIREVFPESTFVHILLEPGISVLDMTMKAGCFATEKDAIRIINAGGLYINQHRSSNHTAVLTLGQHILPNGMSVVRVGKKNFYLIKWEGFITRQQTFIQGNYNGK